MTCVLVVSCLICVFTVTCMLTPAQSIDTELDRKNHEVPLRNSIKEILSLHTKDSPFEMQHVIYQETTKRIVKRAVFNTTTSNWPLRIPYKFKEGFPVKVKALIQRVMQEIMNNLCVKLIEEPTFDPDNNRYDTNSILVFVKMNKNSKYPCYADFGQGDGKSEREISACLSYEVIIHELFHSLGAVHEHQAPLSRQHVSVNLDNTGKGLRQEYDHFNLPGLFKSGDFDGSSIMMYQRTKTGNGLEIMLPLREEEFNLDNGHLINEANIYYELNMVYKCREKHCKHIQWDCGIGYLTYIKGECRCVCPDGFDHKTKCTKFEDENSGPDRWPNTPFTLHADEKDQCPAGFTIGNIELTGISLVFSPYPEKEINLCTRVTTDDHERMDGLPIGSYCVIKPKDSECNGGFEQLSYTLKSETNVTYDGDIGDWEIDGKRLTSKICCQRARTGYSPIELPRHSPFMLIFEGLGLKCQSVKGMKSLVRFISIPWKDGSRTTFLLRGVCLYKPPEYVCSNPEYRVYATNDVDLVGKNTVHLNYGCSENIKLDAQTRMVTIKTPGFDEGEREKNKRCLYYFHTPEAARIKVTMEIFDIDREDEFYVKRFNKWSKPYRNFADYPKKEFLSENGFLFMEYWSGMENSTHRGIKFTAEVLLAEESCYQESDRGRSYKGDKWLAETFEECLHWFEAVDCHDFPFDSADTLHLLSSTKRCRNPGGSMLQPWCYVNVHRRSCRKRYCDVCNYLEFKDQLTNCTDYENDDPDFCTKALHRSNCAKTCSINVPSSSDSAKQIYQCGKPTLPSDGTATESLKDKYNVGDVVRVQCSDPKKVFQIATLECTLDGWTTSSSACSGCPNDGVLYGDRCVFFSPGGASIEGSNDFCESKGGEMFTYNVPKDVNIIHSLKRYKVRSWVNSKLDNGEWLLYNDNCSSVLHMTWAPDQNIRDEQRPCVIQDGEDGKFHTVTCDGYAMAVCESEVPKDYICEDRHPNCAKALEKDPKLCTREKSFSLASQYCTKSCGICPPENANCRDPLSSTYQRISPASQRSVGDVMEFACNPGLFLHSGNLRRMCSDKGTLLGTEPVCRSNPKVLDIGIEGVKYWPRVRKREGYFSYPNVIIPNKAYLFDMDGFRIPFHGRVTHWHFYASNRGKVTFFIFRRTNRRQLTYVGHNTIKVQTPNTRYTAPVSVDDQIVVQKGDLYAVWTKDNLITGRTCNSVEEPATSMPYEDEFYQGRLIMYARPFDKTMCVFASVGLRLKPT